MRAAILVVVATFVLAGCGGGGGGESSTGSSSPATPPANGGHGWVAAYGAAMQGAFQDGALGDPGKQVLPGGQGHDQSFRMMAPVTAGGSAIRLTLSNRYGTGAVQFGAVRAAIRSGTTASVRASTTKQVSFGGDPTVTIPAGQTATSDAVALPVHTGDFVAVSLYVQGPTGPITWHFTQPTTSYIAPPGSGDHTIEADGGAFATATTSVFWLSAIDVRPTAKIPGAVVVLGDSIADGSFLPNDQHARWTDQLAARLRAQPAARRPALVNAGIGGNRLTGPGLQYDSPSAPSRYAADVTARTDVKTVVLAEGINDVTHGATARQVIAALRSLAARAKARGLRVLGATLSPVGNSGLPSVQVPQIEAARQAVNRWVRRSGTFAAVVDYDKVMRDPANPTQLNPALDSGDHVHPNPAGDKAIADSITPSALVGG